MLMSLPGHSSPKDPPQSVDFSLHIVQVFSQRHASEKLHLTVLECMCPCYNLTPDIILLHPNRAVVRAVVIKIHFFFHWTISFLKAGTASCWLTFLPQALTSNVIFGIYQQLLAVMFNWCATRLFKTHNTWLIIKGTNLFSLRLSI